MSYEILVAMNVVDQRAYALYREGMMPILKQYNGGFRDDFIVAKVLKTRAPHGVTRIFTIFFPNQETSATFFADPEYLKVKKAHYDGAVDGFTVLAKQTLKPAN